MSYVGQSVARREDYRLLTGQGQYIDDLELPGLLHVAFVRSEVAHARIVSVNLAGARSAPGVVLALSGAELATMLPPIPDNQVVLPAKWKAAIPHTILNPRQALLADDKVRHVGEAFAVIVANSRAAAEDALEHVEVVFEPLPAVIDPEAALAPGATLLHEQFGTNAIGEFTMAMGDAARAIAAAPHRISRRFKHHRYAAMPLETRGVVAQYDRRTDALTIWCSTQVVHWVRREASVTLGMPEARIRCIALDVGGGFGVKGHVYPEDMLVPFLARKLGCPVKWIEDRREHFTSACHSRDQIHQAEIGFDDDGRILGFSDELVMDCGAWNPLGVAPVYNTACHLQGPYRIEHMSVLARIATTNKVPNAPYRGAGRPEAVQVMERLIDLIAAQLQLEPAEVRRRNMISASAMPYRTGTLYRDGIPIVYDSGDYPLALEQALDAIGGVSAFRARQQAARAQGRWLGLGIGCYTEGTGAGPFEGATVRVDPSGRIFLAAGSCPQGQGMETVFAQIIADQWGVAPEAVVTTFADTAGIPMGFGTIASRSTVNLSGAIHGASERLRRKVFEIGAHLLECAAGDLELVDGHVVIKGVPGRKLPLARIAAASRPGWDSGRPANVEAGLEETFYWEPATVTWSYAVHAVIIEVDPGLGSIAILDYAIAHDCGTVVNPMLAEGQIVGGAAQGLGGALLEDLDYAPDGQLRGTHLADYLLPTALDVPNFKVIHHESPTPLNPLGVKGLGEGGAIAPPVAIANALCDALSAFGVEFNSTPIRPQQIVQSVAAARH